MTSADPRDRPLVSIVTPSLDQGSYIEAAIRSVAEQDYPRIEHIVVDGGSTDATLEVLRQHSRLRWVSEPDDGQAAAINKGFRMATGRIFSWLNADDLLLPGAVSAAVAALDSSGAALAHGGWRQIDDEGETIRDVGVVPFDYRRQLEVENRVAQPGSFFTREAWERVGGLDETLHYALDYELWLKLGRLGVVDVDAPLGAYRYHGTSKTVAEYDRFWPETWRAARKHGARLRSPLFLDYYLPRRSPLLYRATRLVRRTATRVARPRQRSG